MSVFIVFSLYNWKQHPDGDDVIGMGTMAAMPNQNKN